MDMELKDWGLLEFYLGNLPPRDFTMTEQFELEAAVTRDPFLWAEDNYAVTQVGDRMEAISDNLYRVTWGLEEAPKRGPFSIFTGIRQALNAVGVATEE